jgi:signal transduction histidine kinase
MTNNGTHNLVSDQYNSPLHHEDVERDLTTLTAVHELREPVQAIFSFLCVLLEGRTGPLSDLQRDFLSTADQATRRLMRRIEDLQLIMSEHQDFTIRPEVTDLLQRATACCNELSQIARSHNVQLQMDTLPAMQIPHIWADPDRIDQILLNLIENAIQYSRRGGTVHVKVEACLPDNWSVTVRNTVEGPSSENPSDWFMPQTRGQHGIIARSDGQGLGLTAAKTLARIQGGDIIATVSDRTVTMTAWFPVWRDDAATNPLDNVHSTVNGECGDC